MAFTTPELKAEIRLMFADAGPSAAQRHAYVLTRMRAISAAQHKTTSGKRIVSQSSAGFSATFAQDSGTAESRSQLALLDSLDSYADYANVTLALAAVPPAVKVILGDCSRLRR